MRIRKRSLLPFITFTPTRPLSDLLPHKNPSQKEQETTKGGAKTAVEEPAAKADEGNEVKGLHPDEDLKKVQSSRDFTCQSSLQRPKGVLSRSPSDLQLTIVKRKNQWILSDDKEEKPTNPNQVKALQEEEDGAGYKTNRRNGNSSGAETATKLPSPSSTSPPQVLLGRWGEVERAFPLKKRRGSLGYGGGGGGMIVEKERKMKSKPKIKRPKKLNHNDNDYDYEEEEDDDGDEEIDGGVKKRGRSSSGGALMEGSRCSRVNGRGWRCCQQTLVGYSLCEHHLGKGRLRSMSSVRSRSSAVTRPNSNGSSNLRLLSSSEIKETMEEMNVDEDEEVITKMKRKKIGIVKARSISSLLGQTHHIETITPVTSAATTNPVV